MAKKTITQSEMYALLGLQVLGKQHLGVLEQLRLAGIEITGEDDDMGHTSDFVYGDLTMKELAKRLGFTIEKPKKK